MPKIFKKHFHILLIGVYTVFFTLVLFILKEIFFPSTFYQEQYLEPTISLDSNTIDPNWEEFESFSSVNQDDVDAAVKKVIYESFSKKYSESQKRKVFFRFVPNALQENIEYSYLPLAETFLYADDIFSHIKKMWVYLYLNIYDTRWRMKGWNIHIYGVERLPDSEFLAILIHEFGHYYDIYSLKWNAFWDISNIFYDISWDSVTTMKAWSQQWDFVSGYSMTNQYEDLWMTSKLYKYISHKISLSKV